MKCLKPFRMKNPKYPEESDLRFIDCPCGKCYPCLVNRRRQWLFRLVSESRLHDYVYFLTLTYDDEHCDGDVHRSHLQKFLKRLRRKIEPNLLKHYSIGEFGTTTFRPHYHCIIFSDVPISSDSIPWYFGFHFLCLAHTSALNYVLHYHVRPKRPFGKDDSRKTFFVCSKRLGLSWLFDADGNVKGEIVRMLCYTPNRVVSDYLGNTFVLPRYYTKKVEELGFTLHDQCITPSNRPNDLIKVMFPDLVFNSDGTVANMSDGQFAQLYFDLLRQSDIKLSKYNYQTKTMI